MCNLNNTSVLVTLTQIIINDLLCDQEKQMAGLSIKFEVERDILKVNSTFYLIYFFLKAFLY